MRGDWSVVTGRVPQLHALWEELCVPQDVGAPGAAPGWHCHTGQQARPNPVPQVLLSKGSSILCDGSSSARGYV